MSRTLLPLKARHHAMDEYAVMTTYEIAARLGISQKRVCEVLKNATRKLKAALENDEEVMQYHREGRD